MSTEQLLLLGGIATALVAIGTLLAYVAKTIRFFIDLRDEVRDFTLDWKGRPARDGQPEVRGVIHRINDIEQQLKPNGGQSMYDKVTQVRDAVAPIPNQRRGE